MIATKQTLTNENQHIQTNSNKNMIGAEVHLTAWAAEVEDSHLVVIRYRGFQISHRHWPREGGGPSHRGRISLAVMGFQGKYRTWAMSLRTGRAVSYLHGSRVWCGEARQICSFVSRPTRKLLLQNSDGKEGCHNHTRKEAHSQLDLAQRWRDGILGHRCTGGVGEPIPIQPPTSKPNPNRDGCLS